MNDPSRIAASLMPDAQVYEMPDVTGPILDAAPDWIVSAVQAFIPGGALAAVGGRV